MNEKHTLLLDPNEPLYVLVDMTGSMLTRDVTFSLVGHDELITITRIAAVQLALRALLSSPHAVPTSKLRILGAGYDVTNTTTPGSPVDVLDMLHPHDAELRLSHALGYVEALMHEEQHTRAAVLVVLDGPPSDVALLDLLDQHSDAYALHVFYVGPDAVDGAASFLESDIRWATSRPTQPSLPPVGPPVKSALLGDSTLTPAEAAEQATWHDDDEALTPAERDATQRAMLEAVLPTAEHIAADAELTREHIAGNADAELTSDADREAVERASTEPPKAPTTEPLDHPSRARPTHPKGKRR